MCCSGCVLVYFFVAFAVLFFFKQKTAYEVRISDWSSDVCSSDLSYRGRSPYSGFFVGAHPVSDPDLPAGAHVGRPHRAPTGADHRFVGAHPVSDRARFNLVKSFARGRAPTIAPKLRVLTAPAKPTIAPFRDRTSTRLNSSH